MIPEAAVPIPGLDGGYLVTPDGEVWSRKWRGPRRLKSFSGDGGPRVCLWRFGRRWCPDVATLVKMTFGEGGAPANDAKIKADILKRYGDDPEVMRWAADAFG
jgi:hypothetical protein